eukprot:3556436-Rhodomonas_salina.2
MMLRLLRYHSLLPYAIIPLWPFSISGTDVGYAATLVCFYAVSGTDVGYAATRRCGFAPKQRWVSPSTACPSGTACVVLRWAPFVPGCGLWYQPFVLAHVRGTRWDAALAGIESIVYKSTPLPAYARPTRCLVLT